MSRPVLSSIRSEMVRILALAILSWSATGTACCQESRSTEVIRLHQMPAAAVAETISSLMPDAVVTADPISNSIILSASPENMLQIRELIESLDAERPQYIRILPLSHRPSDETAELLSRILQGDPSVGTVSIVPDDRINALIVRGTDEEFDHVEQLLRVIDMEPTKLADVRVFPLQNAVAVEAAGLLGELFAHEALSGVDLAGQLRTGVDERTNSVIVSGPADVVSVVEAVLMRLDEGGGEVPGEAESMRIRIIWVVSGDDWISEGDRQPRLGSMPTDLADVSGELESLGIANPRIATQMVINSEREFSIFGSAQLDNPIQVSVRGQVAPASASTARPTLDISIEAVEQVFTRNSGPSSLCQLETTLKAPLGHFVILGVSPINARNSAFVVQVTRLEPTN